MPTGYATKNNCAQAEQKEKGTRVRDIQYQKKCMRRDAMQTS